MEGGVVEGRVALGGGVVSHRGVVGRLRAGVALRVERVEGLLGRDGGGGGVGVVTGGAAGAATGAARRVGAVLGGTHKVEGVVRERIWYAMKRRRALVKLLVRAVHARPAMGPRGHL